MDAIKSNSLSYSLIKKSNSGTQKAPFAAANSTAKQERKVPAFSAALHAEEGLFKKMRELPLKAADKFQRCLETGGFIAEFLLVDFVGMIIPRTIQAYNRNKEELGHPNYAAAKEEFTREILSGPSMFIIPFTFLAASKKMFGSSSHVKLETLKAFKEITTSVINDKKDLAHNFYTKVVETLYGSKIKDDEKRNIIEEFIKLHEKPDNKKEVKAQIKKVKEVLVAANKTIGNNKEMGISMADSSRINLGKISKSVGDFAEECRNYSSDVIVKLSNERQLSSANVNSDRVNMIHEFKEGARKLLTTVSVGSIAAFLWIIPKLYNQNKVYPGLAGLTNTADKNNARLHAIENPALAFFSQNSSKTEEYKK